MIDITSTLKATVEENDCSVLKALLLLLNVAIKEEEKECHSCPTTQTPKQT